MSSGERLVIRNSGVVDVRDAHENLAGMPLPEDADEIVLPLIVRGDARGVLVIEGGDGLKLSAPQLRVASGCSSSSAASSPW